METRKSDLDQVLSAVRDNNLQTLKELIGQGYPLKPNDYDWQKECDRLYPNMQKFTWGKEEFDVLAKIENNFTTKPKATKNAEKIPDHEIPHYSHAFLEAAANNEDTSIVKYIYKNHPDIITPEDYERLFALASVRPKLNKFINRVIYPDILNRDRPDLLIKYFDIKKQESHDVVEQLYEKNDHKERSIICPYYEIFVEKNNLKYNPENFEPKKIPVFREFIEEEKKFSLKQILQDIIQHGAIETLAYFVLHYPNLVNEDVKIKLQILYETDANTYTGLKPYIDVLKLRNSHPPAEIAEDSYQAWQDTCQQSPDFKKFLMNNIIKLNNVEIFKRVFKLIYQKDYKFAPEIAIQAAKTGAVSVLKWIIKHDRYRPFASYWDLLWQYRQNDNSITNIFGPHLIQWGVPLKDVPARFFYKPKTPKQQSVELDGKEFKSQKPF